MFNIEVSLNGAEIAADISASVSGIITEKYLVEMPELIYDTGRQLLEGRSGEFMEILDYTAFDFEWTGEDRKQF